MAQERQLRERVASGVAWNIAEKVGSTLLQIIVSIVVANRIMPIDMGIIAVLSVFISLAQVVIDSGFSQTLIRKENPTEGDFKAVFRFNLIASIGLYLLLVALSPYLAEYYDWLPLGTLQVIAPVLILLLPLNALCVIQNTIMVREFRFAELSTIIFLSSLISGLLAIALALMGFGIWSIVAQRVGMIASKAVLLWWKSPWRPRRDIKCESLREMSPYSLRLIATDMITSLYNNIAQLFIGIRYSGDMLGYFNQAQKLKDTPVNATMQSIQSVTFPALSKIQSDAQKFDDSYRRVVMVTAFVMLPVMTGLIATAQDFYTLLLKPEWHPAIPYFRILCLIGIFYPIAAISYNVLKVRSNGKVILRLEIIKKVAMTLMLVITIPMSVKAIAWGMVLMAALEFILNFVATRAFTGLRTRSFIRTLLPICTLTAVMYASVMFFGVYFAGLSAGVMLFIKIIIGVAVYTLGAMVSGMEAWGEIMTIAKGLIGRKKEEN